MLRAEPQMQFVQMSLFKKKSSIKRSHLERWLNVIADVIPSSIWNNSLLAHCLVFGNDTFSQVATFSGVVVRFWYWSNMQYSENLYRMSETTFDISVFDPFWQFPLPNVVLYATHQENKRLLDLFSELQEGELTVDKLPSAISLNQTMKGKRYWWWLYSCPFSFSDSSRFLTWILQH